MDINEISSIVKYHRKKSGLSQLELANIAGVGKTVIYDLEKGKSTIKLKTLLHILKALNISINLQSPLIKYYYNTVHEKG